MAARRDPPLNPDQFKFTHDISPNVHEAESHGVYAYHPDFAGGQTDVGHLYWTHGTIDLVNVEERHRRQGIGRRLYEEASRYNNGQPLKHSNVRTPMGDKWARKVGGELPENNP